MLDSTNPIQRFIVRETFDMNAPFPQPNDRVTIEKRSHERVLVHVSDPGGAAIVTLRGRLRRRNIEGRYASYGRFSISPEDGDGGLRLRCEIRRDGDPRGGEAGCWVADEDDTRDPEDD